MLSITIPLWLLLSVAGLPALILIGLCARLIRTKLNKDSFAAVEQAPESSTAAAATNFDDRIHRQVLDQQIDAVFDVLSTLIESERCKLKTLVNHAMPLNAVAAEPQAAPAMIETRVEAPQIAQSDTTASEAPAVPLAQTISNLAEEGLTLDEIAQRLGVSLSEVSLALKMNAGRNSHLGRKMMAVA